MNCSWIVIVTQGSWQESDVILDKIEIIPKITILWNSRNGKERSALKLMLIHIYQDYSDFLSFEKADADNQHPSDGIVLIAHGYHDTSHTKILVAWKFNQAVPFCNPIGNRLAEFLIRQVLRTGVTDSQAGLCVILRIPIPILRQPVYNGYEPSVRLFQRYY